MKIGPARYAMAAMLCVAIMAGAPSAPAEEPSLEQLRREHDAMKRQLDQLQQQIKKQEVLIEKLSAERRTAPPAPPAKAETATTDEERLKKEVTENVMRRIQPSLTAANKTFPSQFNPAIGLIVDTIALVQGAARRQLRVPLRRARHVGVRRPVRARLRDHQRDAGRASRSRRRRSSPPRCPTT